MIKLPLFCFISFFFQISAFTQHCLPEGITFETQAQIDSFQVNYPGCTTIEGGVYITGDDISNLAGINVLDSIHGMLGFVDTEFLVDMTGLNNLRYVGYLHIEDNEGLINFTGFDNLQTIAGNLEIEVNFALSSLAGLESLQTIGGNLDIGWNPILPSLEGFDNLQTIGGNLKIRWNYTLSSLAGLENISAGSINDINIYDNTYLSDCNIQGICDYLAAPNGQVDIYQNATGCNNPPEIAQSCGITLTCLPFGNYHFSSQEEIDNYPASYSNCDYLIGYVSINGEDITHLDSLSGIDTINGTLSICDNQNLSNLAGLNNIKKIQGGLKLGWMECNGNSALTTWRD